MTTIIGVAGGVAMLVGHIISAATAVKHELKQCSIMIDTVKKELRIKCNAKAISLENFRVYVHMENKQLYLYVRGTEVLESSKEIATVDHKYRLKNIAPADITKMAWSINNEGELVVTIPLSTIDKNLSVIRIE